MYNFFFLRNFALFDSILGVTKNCPDEVIKKYYKRQAVLVHPDKNNQPGAEEAFKILVHAFELIGEPVRSVNIFTIIAFVSKENRYLFYIDFISLARYL